MAIKQHSKDNTNIIGNRFRFAIACGGIVLGTIILAFLFTVKIAWLRAILIFLGSLIISFYILLVLSISIISIPDSYKKKIASLIAGIYTVIYVFLFSGSKMLRIITVVFLCLKAVETSYKYIKKTLVKGILNQLYKYYVSKASFSIDYAFAYILAAPGLAAYYGHRLATNITGSRIKSPSDTKCFVFFHSGYVNNYSIEFRRFLISRAGVILLLSKDSNFSDYDKNTIQEIFENSMGRIIVILFSRPENIREDRIKEGGIVYISKEHLLHIDLFMKELTTRILDELMPAYPLALADNRLPYEMHLTMRKLASEGLQPLAGSYLRFRTAESDVERLLCLLDCIEVLIKSSAIVLIINSWKSRDKVSPSDITSRLRIPSLGIWTGLLRELIDDNSEDELVKRISLFWRKPIQHEFHRQLITDVDGSGLSWKGEIPRSHIGWLDWFVWLRNVTRGHGVLGDKIASPIWQSFHEVFLTMVIGLQDLVFVSPTVNQDNKQNNDYIHGWDRKRYLRPENERDEEVRKMYLQIENNGQLCSVMLYPLAVGYMNSILLWNRVKEEWIEYIDYSSGKLVKFNLLGTDPYVIWTRSR